MSKSTQYQQHFAERALPALSAAGAAVLVQDSADGLMKVSQNGGAFVSIITAAGIGGSTGALDNAILTADGGGGSTLQGTPDTLVGGMLSLNTDGTIELDDRASDPAVALSHGYIYAKDVATISELFYRDDAANVVQITSGGSVAGGGTLITPIPDNTAIAWQIIEGANPYITADTRNGAEVITIGGGATSPKVTFDLPSNSSALQFITTTNRSIFKVGGASPGTITIGNSTDQTILKFDATSDAQIDFSASGGIGRINLGNDDAIRGSSNRRMLSSNSSTLFLGGDQTWDVEIEAGTADTIRMNIATANKATISATGVAMSDELRLTGAEGLVMGTTAVGGAAITFRANDYIMRSGGDFLLGSNASTIFVGSSTNTTLDVDIVSDASKEIRLRNEATSKVVVAAALTTLDNTTTSIESGGTPKLTVTAADVALTVPLEVSDTGAAVATIGAIRLEDAFTIGAANGLGASKTIIGKNASDVIQLGQNQSIATIRIDVGAGLDTKFHQAGVERFRVDSRAHAITGFTLTSAAGQTVATTGDMRVRNGFTLNADKSPTGTDFGLMNFDSSEDLNVGHVVSGVTRPTNVVLDATTAVKIERLSIVKATFAGTATTLNNTTTIIQSGGAAKATIDGSNTTFNNVNTFKVQKAAADLLILDGFSMETTKAIKISSTGTPAGSGDLRVGNGFAMNADSSPTGTNYGLLHFDTSEQLNVGHNLGGATRPVRVISDGGAEIKLQVSNIDKLAATSTTTTLNNTSTFFQSGAANKIQINATGIGFFNTTAIAKPTVTGSRGGNAALASLLTALANLGLLTDSSS